MGLARGVSGRQRRERSGPPLPVCEGFDDVADEVPGDRWGDGVSGESSAFAAGALPSVVGGKGHAGSGLGDLRHPELAVVDVGHCGGEVAWCDDGPLALGAEGPESLAGRGGRPGDVAFGAVLPHDRGVAVPGGESADHPVDRDGGHLPRAGRRGRGFRYRTRSTALGSAQGVYLIADSSGRLYLGKADRLNVSSGDGAPTPATVTGGNMALRQLTGPDTAHREHFQCSILRVSGRAVHTEHRSRADGSALQAGRCSRGATDSTELIDTGLAGADPLQSVEPSPDAVTKELCDGATRGVAVVVSGPDPVSPSICYEAPVDRRDRSR